MLKKKKNTYTCYYNLSVIYQYDLIEHFFKMYPLTSMLPLKIPISYPLIKRIIIVLCNHMKYNDNNVRCELMT